MSALLDLNACLNGTICVQCGKEGADIRCRTCQGFPMFCDACCTDRHAFLPFHAIERWKDGCFWPTSLRNLGLVIHMGHGGVACPSTDKGNLFTYGELEIVDTSGVYKHNVQWCKCVGAAKPYLQLIHAGFYPASMLRPESAFTQDVLRYFHVDYMECNTTAMAFYRKIRRLSNADDPDSVAVCTSSTY